MREFLMLRQVVTKVFSNNNGVLATRGRKLTTCLYMAACGFHGGKVCVFVSVLLFF